MSLLQFFYEIQLLYPTRLSFFFVMLPLFLLVYYLVPGRLRPSVLLVESLWFYAYGWSGASFLLLAASVAADYIALRLMERFDAQQNIRRACLWFSVVKGLALIAGYAFFAPPKGLSPPLGIHIYTLSAMGCLLEAYRREIPYERNPFRFGLYCCFFPILYAGPIQPYKDFTASLEQGARLCPGEMLLGAGQYIEGVFKTAILGRSLYDLFWATGSMREMTMLSAWMRVFSFAFALYFMLSGFSDMAQGLGRMFGLRLPRNFYYPYQSRSVQDFVERFNMTIHSFLSRALPGKLQQTEKKSPWSCIVGIVLVCSLGGLWFGLRLNYLIWGVYLAAFIIMEQYLYPRLLVVIPVLFRRIGTLCVVLAGFTIFIETTPARSALLVRSLFQYKNVLDTQALYLLASNWLLLVVSCFLATNAINIAATRLRKAAPALAAVLFGAVDILIFVLYIALYQNIGA